MKVTHIISIKLIDKESNIVEFYIKKEIVKLYFELGYPRNQGDYWANIYSKRDGRTYVKDK